MLSQHLHVDLVLLVPASRWQDVSIPRQLAGHRSPVPNGCSQASTPSSLALYPGAGYLYVGSLSSSLLSRRAGFHTLAASTVSRPTCYFSGPFILPLTVRMSYNSLWDFTIDRIDMPNVLLHTLLSASPRLAKAGSAGRVLSSLIRQDDSVLCALGSPMPCCRDATSTLASAWEREPRRMSLR